MDKDNLSRDAGVQTGNASVSGGIPDFGTYPASCRLKTGFEALDAQEPLTPGLHVLTGASSAGKTMFALQLAEQLAAGGTPVLFFSMAQPRLELQAHMTARSFFLEQRRRMLEGVPGVFPAPENRDILYGTAAADFPEETEQMIRYTASRVGDRLRIIDDAGSMRGISECVENACCGGACHVVIVDAMQDITQPDSDEGLSPAAAVRALGALQARCRTALVACADLEWLCDGVPDAAGISACEVWGFSRAKPNPADWRDVRLNSAGWKKAVQAGDGGAELLRSPAAQDPDCGVELSCLKNRMGPSGWTVKFGLWPAHSTFLCAG